MNHSKIVTTATSSTGNTSLIRPLESSDMNSIKKVISATDLFPSDMLDDMVSDYFTDTSTKGKSASHWFAADHGANKAVGVIYCAPEVIANGVYNCLLLAVHPGFHGRGIGSALLRHAEESLPSTTRLMLVETSGISSFERTRGFYIMSGYTQEAVVRDYYDEGNDKIIYMKRFKPTK